MFLERLGVLPFALLLLAAQAVPVAVASRASPKPLTERVSVASSGVEGNGPSVEGTISGDGRFVAIQSLASNLVPRDTNGAVDIFVYDRRTERTKRVSVSSSEAEATGATLYLESPWLSVHGGVVAFGSDASTLVSGDTNGARDVFVRDRRRGTTERISVASSGAQANGSSGNLRISDDGRFVVFESDASNLVRADTNGATDVFVHDRKSGKTRRVSVSSSRAEGNGSSWDPAISGDGSWVSFTSSASNLVRGDTNAASDVFVHDLHDSETRRVSISSAEREANGNSLESHLSRHGGLVAFTSESSNLIRGDSNDASDTFVRDRSRGATERISISSSGAQGKGDSNRVAGFGGRRLVAFSSTATNLVPGDTNRERDVFVHDRTTGTTKRLSVSGSGRQGNGRSGGARLSADGRIAAFTSFASNLVRRDTNNTIDVFIRGPLQTPR